MKTKMTDETPPKETSRKRAGARPSGAAVALGLLLLLAACGEEASQSAQSLQAVRSVPSEARPLLDAAMQAMQQGAFITALALADSAAQVAPGLPETAFIQGRTYFELGRMAEAREAYRAVLERDANFEGAWHNLGNVAFRQKQFREALRYYEKEAALHAAAPNPWHGMGGAYESLGRADSARWAYEKAAEVDPDYMPAYLSLATWHQDEGDFEKALEYARRAHELAPADLDARYLVGGLAFQAGRHEEAIEMLTPVAEAQPWNYSALFTLGQAHQRLGHDAEARRTLAQANQVRAQQAEVERIQREAGDQPENFDRQIAYADALRRTGRLAEAFRPFHVAASLRPDNLALRNNLATLYLQRGDTTEALARYRQILQRDSTFAEAWLNLALHYGRTGRREAFDQALRRAVAHGQDNPTVQAFLDQARRKD